MKLPGKKLRKTDLSHIEKSETLALDLFSQYVSNHATSKYAIPVACVLIGLMLVQFRPLTPCVIWVALSIMAAVAFTLSSMYFERLRDRGADRKAIRASIGLIVVSRMAFILLWCSISIWGWSAETPESFFVIITVLLSTLAMNASQSGPVLRLYFMEALPKFLAVIYMSYVAYESVNLAELGAIGAVTAMLFFTKIAFSINKSTRMILAQKHALAIANEEVQQASKAKSEFLATMSHEVRTPLNGVLGIVSLMKDTNLTREQEDYVETIRHSGETLLAMLNDILDFSKIEAGHMDIEKVPFDLSQTVKSVFNLMMSRAMEKRIGFHVDVAPDVPACIVSDPTRLRQVLLNLISNAIKFTDAGQVTLKITMLDKQTLDNGGEIVRLRFAVSDTGIGVPVEAQEKLFKQFVQVDSSISRRFGGTGLGLSICQRIVELLDGGIDFESQPGKGSTFWFDIPAEVAIGYDSAMSSSTDKSENIPLLRPLRILLAEDNKTNQKVAIGILKKYGHHIDVAEDGMQAIEAVQEKNYDVILMDMQMPVVDGLQATQQIRKISDFHAKLPIIALTANALNGDHERCVAAGMNDHIAKPIRPAALFRALAIHLPHKVVYWEENNGQPNLSDMPATGAPPLKPAILSAPKPPTIDLSHIRELERTLGSEFVGSFIDESLAEIEALSESMSRYFAEKDERQLQESSHNMKSLSALVGMRDVSHLAEGIELCCIQGRIEETSSLFERFRERLEPDIMALRRTYCTGQAA